MSLNHKLLTFIAAVVTITTAAFAQEKEPSDSLVRLMSAQSAQMTNYSGESIRKVIGPARFLHNGTYLLCDTAIWRVDAKIINAFGNVKIMQDETVLSSDKLDYFVDDNRAEFRGVLVQLQDKDGNTLKTKYLDYNTKDSVAVFNRGGSMRDKDGQIIESLTGSYDSKTKEFDFTQKVNMYTDSVFVKTNHLLYKSNEDIAYFDGGVDAWRDDKMLSSLFAVYEKRNEIFHFYEDVHGLTHDQECWADSLLYYRIPNDAEMFGHTQILDTTKNVSAVAEYVKYIDTLSRVILQGEAAVSAVTRQDRRIDTLYVGADFISYRAIPRCAVDSAEVVAAQERLNSIDVDPVDSYRHKAKAAADEEAKNAKLKEEEEMASKPGGNLASGGGNIKKKSNYNLPPKRNASKNSKKDKKSKGTDAVDNPDAELPAEENAPAVGEDKDANNSSVELAGPESKVDRALKPKSVGEQTDDASAQLPVTPTEDLPAPSDSTLAPSDSTLAPSDSTSAVMDSLAAVVPDSTRIGFVKALGNVKMFRRDLQAVCDSLVYNDLDSLARLFIDPVVWNEGGKHQYTSDSLFLVVRNQTVEKASLQSNAFITIQEDTVCYDQIRGAEMMAYFDTTMALTRFDALGGSDALFYLKENDALATVNKVESKMLSANFEKGELSRIYYFDKPQNDAYPVVQLPKEDRRKKGFNWQPDLRPKSKEDITAMQVRTSERAKYKARPRAQFKETDKYFPGYIEDVYQQIHVRDSIRRQRHLEQQMAESMPRDTMTIISSDSLVVADTLKVNADTLAVSDTLLSQMDSTNVADSLNTASPAVADSAAVAGQAADSLSVKDAADSTVVVDPDALKKAEKEKLRQEKERLREERQKKRDEKIAELDARDERKAEAKKQKQLQKQRKRTMKELQRAEKRAAKEQKYLDRYVKMYEKRLARKNKRQKPDSELETIVPTP